MNLVVCENASLAEQLATLPQRELDRILSNIRPGKTKELWHDWGFWGRVNQHPPAGDWQIWLLLAGRGIRRIRAQRQA
jgi:phage terminase large subunit-like protein